MSRIFSTFVVTLCLLALFVSSAACVALPPQPQHAAMMMDSDMPAHTVGSPDHECCPSNSPAQHTSVSCCTVHHQPAAASASDKLNPTHGVTADHLPAALVPAATVTPPTGRKTGVPPRRPATKLRI